MPWECHILYITLLLFIWMRIKYIRVICSSVSSVYIEVFLWVLFGLTPSHKLVPEDIKWVPS